jgi:hypothetical protein
MKLQSFNIVLNIFLSKSSQMDYTKFNKKGDGLLKY